MDETQIENEKLDYDIRRRTESLFNPKGGDINNPLVMAGMITAASEIAMASDKISRDTVIEELGDLYNVLDNKEVDENIGNGIQFVNPLTGFSVNYKDYGASRAYYESIQVILDEYYDKINKRSTNRSINNSK